MKSLTPNPGLTPAPLQGEGSPIHQKGEGSRMNN